MRFAYPALLICVAACASAPSAVRSTVAGNTAVAPSTLEASSAAVPSRGYLITGSVKTEYFTGESLYDVLRVRMPLYLRPRGVKNVDLTGRAEPVSVFINGSFAGPLETLTLIPASHVYSVQRMSGTEAAIKFGPRHSGGAILVTLHR